ncbi:MAG TPA: glycosyltransferase [Polyangiaceae bacterium]|nr:glycosyltransferase [Polyangiaceae bacterium]
MAARPTVCLNMIVKNEAKVIARSLASTRPFIDAWAIVDTGSSDGTQDVIRQELRDVPGELFERPWRDFGTNRSEALELAKGRADYTLIIDADEVLAPSPGFGLPELTLDAYQLRTEFGGVRYYRTQLVRSSLPWRYEGVLHEVLACDASFTQGKLEGLVNRPQSDGARSADPQKYVKDAAVFEQALKREPHNTRYVFYLAQSYRDAGLDEAALVNYARRAKLGGWDEEVWYSMFQVASLLERLARPEHEVVIAYLDAHQFRPQRAESLCELARYLRTKKKFALAYVFARQAADTPMPSDTLFVHEGTYSWRARDELSIAAYYVGKHEEAITLTTALLDGATLPEAERARVMKNREFSLNALKPNQKGTAGG